MSDKHACLIMAHHRPDLLQLLLDALDDERNDIYVHIDRSAAADMKPGRFAVKRSRLHFIPGMHVNWGGYSQISCTLRLLEAAVNGGPYAYYHLMTGATYPLKSQDEIHRFFREIDGLSCVAFDNPGPHIERVRYVYLFNESGRNITWDDWRQMGRPLRMLPAAIKSDMRMKYLHWQAQKGVSRFDRFQMEFRKGLAYWSVTHELAAYLLKKEDLIRQMLRHSMCGDEVFVQTIAWNSPFRERIFDLRGEKGGSMRLSTWGIEDAGGARPGHNFRMEDLELLRSSGALFALKFEGPDGLALIRALQGQVFPGSASGEKSR